MGMLRLEEEGLQVYLAQPSTPGPGVVVLHAWWGLVPDVADLCDRLAAEGFVAVAPDLHGSQVADTPEAAERLVMAGDWAARAEMAAATVGWLRQQPNVLPNRVGLLGLSMGAATALIAAGHGVGDAVVTFYGTFPLGPSARIRVPLLGHFAEQDEFEAPEDVAAFVDRLRGDGTPAEFHTYPGTDHWFFEPSRSVYDPEASREAWEKTLQFLRQNLGD